VIPYEDLVRSVCDWIALHLLNATAPQNSCFELEAKLGQIEAGDTGVRIQVPVRSETILDRDQIRNIRFASTMDEVSQIQDEEEVGALTKTTETPQTLQRVSQ
jgi:hypothetical protein